MARLNISDSPHLKASGRGTSRSQGTSVGKKQSMSSQDVVGSKVRIGTSAPTDPYTMGRSTKSALK